MNQKIARHSNWGSYYRCANCGKRFYVLEPDVYAYKLNKHQTHTFMFCTWTCIQEGRKKLGNPKYKRVGEYYDNTYVK